MRTEYQAFDTLLDPPAPVGPIWNDKVDADKYAGWLGEGVIVKSREVGEWN